MRDPPSKLLRLEGPRLYLRPVRLEDANETYLRWLRDPEVVRYLEARLIAHTPESLQRFVTTLSADPAHVFLAIVLKAGDRHIGNIKLGPIHEFHRCGDLGLFIGEKVCWGKGYATEAIVRLARYAFQELKLHKLTAGCYGINRASARAFAKAGFVIEGIRPRHFNCEGRYVDAVLLGLLNPQEDADTPPAPVS